MMVKSKNKKQNLKTIMHARILYTQSRYLGIYLYNVLLPVAPKMYSHRLDIITRAYFANYYRSK